MLLGNGLVDRPADPPQVIPHFMVWEAQHPQALLAELPVPHLVCVPTVQLLMLPPVQLDHQGSGPTVKVHYVFADHPLPVPVQGVFPQKAVPECLLLQRHVPPKLPRPLQHVIPICHFKPLSLYPLTYSFPTICLYARNGHA